MGDKFIVLRTIVSSEVCDLDNYPGMTLEEARKYEEDMHLADYVESGALQVGDPKLISTALNPWDHAEQYKAQDGAAGVMFRNFGEMVSDSIEKIKADNLKSGDAQAVCMIPDCGCAGYAHP